MLKKVLFSILIFFISTNSNFAKDLDNEIILITGKPYKIKGKWYYPKNNFNYSEVGIASVYKKKNKKKTKNGEVFLNGKVFAKHKSLALPTIVRVTNLYNGYSINIRINDRGPKNNFRILELSKKSAEYLKINSLGLVDIEVMPNLTIKEQAKLKKNLKNNIENENLEKNIALGKIEVESEDLMRNSDKEIINEPIYNEIIKDKKELKLNYRKIIIDPFYLRIKITKFRKFEHAQNLKEKMKSINNKILISLDLLNGQKYYKVTTVPIKDLNDAERTLKAIHNYGFKNANFFIERKRK